MTSFEQEQAIPYIYILIFLSMHFKSFLITMYALSFWCITINVTAS